MTEEGIRAQIFEVIVRQALAGAPWREICANPMRVHGLTVDDVEAEVQRRRSIFEDALDETELKLLSEHVSQWERISVTRSGDLEASKETNKEKIKELVGRIYETQTLPLSEKVLREGKSPVPPIIFCDSLAEWIAYLNLIHFRADYDWDIPKNWLEILCTDQDEDFKTQLKQKLDTFELNGELCRPLTATIGPTWNHILEQQGYSEPLETAPLGPRLFSMLGTVTFAEQPKEDYPDLREFFRLSFRTRVAPFLDHIRSLYDIAISQLPGQTIQVVRLLPTNAFFGDHNIGGRLREHLWGIWGASAFIGHGFISEHLGGKLKTKPENVEMVRCHLELFKMVPWISFFENYCFVGSYPKSTLLDLQRRPSNTEGAAITFADGYKIFAVSGLVVPRRFLENPELLTIGDIDREENVETRRGLIELYGAARYLEDSGAQLIHEDECGQLYQREISGDEPLTMVRVVNSTPEPDGSYRTFFLRVPPTITTAREAVAWTFDIDDAEEYKPLQES